MVASDTEVHPSLQTEALALAHFDVGNDIVAHGVGAGRRHRDADSLDEVAVSAAILSVAASAPAPIGIPPNAGSAQSVITDECGYERFDDWPEKPMIVR